MAFVTVEVLGGGSGADDNLIAALADTNLLPERFEHGVRISVATFEDCDEVGKTIAALIGDRQGIKLRIDGPGATTTIHQLGRENDAKVIAGYVATCAHLQ
jgi:hypothetical protein